MLVVRRAAVRDYGQFRTDLLLPEWSEITIGSTTCATRLGAPDSRWVDVIQIAFMRQALQR
jgi:hypothetical protein